MDRVSLDEKTRKILTISGTLDLWTYDVSFSFRVVVEPVKRLDKHHSTTVNTGEDYTRSLFDKDYGLRE